MKRWIAMLVLATLLLGVAGCDADLAGISSLTDSLEAFRDSLQAMVSSSDEETDADAAAELVSTEADTDAESEDTAEQTAQDDAPAAVDTTEDAEEIEQIGAEEELAAWLSSLPVEECVKDAWPEAGVLPHITIDCTGAEEINAAIDEMYMDYADDPMCVVSYQCFLNDYVLSILMTLDYQTDYKEYTTYNLNLITGEAMTGADLLEIFSAEAQDMENRDRGLMGEEFTYAYSEHRELLGAELYDEQYARTIAEDNTDLENLWIGGDGQLYFIGRIYSLAGADYYYYQLGTGLYM